MACEELVSVVLVSAWWLRHKLENGVKKRLVLGKVMDVVVLVL